LRRLKPAVVRAFRHATSGRRARASARADRIREPENSFSGGAAIEDGWGAFGSCGRDRRPCPRNRGARENAMAASG
jgi:hypothetical protein